MAACPSVRELLVGVKYLTRRDGTFQTAWSGSFPDAYHCCEQGGYIYVDFPVPTPLTRAFITRARRGETMNQRTAGPNASINLNSPGIQRDDAILVANFHTHPLSSRVGGDPQPSRTDMRNAYDRGVPGIVVSRDGIYSYGPERREDTNNPKGYPGPVTPPAFFRPNLVRAPFPPWTVSNQWPEGTGEDAVRTLVENEATGDSDASGPDVICVEWSDEGVVYGEPLIESGDSIEIRSEGDEQ